MYVCPDWHGGLEIADGTALADAYRERNCNLYVRGYADMDEDGTADNFQADNQPQCGEHDSIAQWHADRYQGVLAELHDALFTCEEHGEPGNTLLFNTEDGLDEHNLTVHGVTPETPPIRPAPTPGTYWHDAPLFPHPAIPPERLEKATRLAKTDTIRGLLIAGHTIPQERAINKGVLTTSRPPTPDALLRWALDYPGWFYIAKDDPHLTISPGKTTHAGWA